MDAGNTGQAGAIDPHCYAGGRSTPGVYTAGALRSVIRARAELVDFLEQAFEFHPCAALVGWQSHELDNYLKFASTTD